MTLARVKKFLGRKRMLLPTAAAAVAVLSMSVPCFAAESGSFDVSALMSTCVSSMVSDALSMITTVMPVIVTVFTATIVIRFGMKFVKGIFSKAG